jgi:hypothetical protein
LPPSDLVEEIRASKSSFGWASGSRQKSAHRIAA